MVLAPSLYSLENYDEHFPLSLWTKGYQIRKHVLMKRKTNRGCGQSWTMEQLNGAMGSVTSKSMSISRAASHFGIPFSTLQLKINGWRGRKSTAKVTNGGGRHTTLSTDKEEHIASLLKTMNKWGFGLAKSQVLDIVQEYLQTNQISTPFTNDRPGNRWFRAFCARNKLSLKKPELMESSRARQASDPFIVKGFYEALSDVIKDLGLEKKPHLIFNCDETGLRSDPTSTKVVAEKGASCHRESNGNGRKSTTMLACVNAAGEKLPPLIVHKGKRLWDSMLGDNAYPGTSYYVTDDGWMTREVFTCWFRKEFLTRVKERPALLIYDGHLSHVGADLITHAMQSEVTILKMPPHTSHILQPCDVTIFRGFKSKWDAKLSNWVRQNRGKNLPKSEFADLVGETWSEVNSDVIIKGFKTSGIYDKDLSFPVNFQAIPDSKFDPEKLKRFKNRNISDDCVIPTELTTTATIQPQLQETSDNIFPDVFSLNMKIDFNSLTKQFSVTTPSVTPFTVNVPVNDDEVTQNLGCPIDKISFESLLLRTVTPAKSEGTRKRKRIDIAEVITKEDYLQKIQKENEAKVSKQKKKSSDGKNIGAPRRGRPRKILGTKNV